MIVSIKKEIKDLYRINHGMGVVVKVYERNIIVDCNGDELSVDIKHDNYKIGDIIEVISVVEDSNGSIEFIFERHYNHGSCE